MPFDSLMVFTGNANPRLVEEVARHMNIALGRAKVGRFSDGEVAVEILENVRGKYVFILQSTCNPTNDNLMEIMEACPAGALTFGKRGHLLQLARRKIENEPERYVDHVYGEREVGGTSWLYISGVPFGDLGFPTNLPKEPLIDNTKGFLAAVPTVLVVWPALFGMCYAALKHREAAVSEEEKKEQDRG